MTQAELLLVHLIEECDEVSQRATKALRFGLDEVQAGQPLTNAQRIIGEFRDLMTIVDMMQEKDILPCDDGDAEFERHLAEKRAKVVGWLKYSEARGTLQP